MKRNLFVCAAVFCVIIVCLSGGGRPAGEQSSQGESTTLNFMSWGDANEIQIMKSLLAEFEKKNPDIKVKYEANPGNYRQKLQTLFASGTAPDVFYMSIEDYPIYAQKNVLADLAPYLKKSKVVQADDFFSDLLDFYRQGEQILALPKDFSPWVLYYNKQLFQEAGEEYPTENWGWEEFLNAARKLTKGNQQWGTALAWAPYLWPAIIWQNGGEVLNSSGDRCLVDSPEALEAIRWYANLYLKEKVVPSPLTGAQADSQQLFMLGKIGMYPGTAWNRIGFRNIKDFEWSFAPLPKGKKRASVFSNTGYCMSKTSKKAEAAWKLIEFLAGPQGQLLNGKAGTAYPALRSVAVEQEIIAPTAYPNEPNEIFANSLSYCRPLPQISGYPEMFSDASEALERIWNKVETPEEAMRKLANHLNAQLGKLGKR